MSIPIELPEEDDFQALLRAVLVIEAFREINARMSVSFMAAFLTIAKSPGLGTSEYAKLWKMSQPSASRLLMALGPKGRQGSEGLELVQFVVNPLNLTRHCYYLTPKGKALVDRITKAINQHTIPKSVPVSDKKRQRR